MKSEVAAVIESFQTGEISEATALARIHELTGREIDGDWLRNYWRSESIEDFVDRLCAEPIRDWERITDEEALTLVAELVAEYMETRSPGRRDSIEEALSRRFGKPTGTISDLVFQCDLSDPGIILAELKRDTRIYL